MRSLSYLDDTALKEADFELVQKNAKQLTRAIDQVMAEEYKTQGSYNHVYPTVDGRLTFDMLKRDILQLEQKKVNQEAKKLCDDDITFAFLQDQYPNIALFFAYQTLVQNRSSSTSFVANLGILEKLEMLIIFIQLFSLIFAGYGITWPSGWSNIVKYFTLFKLSLYDANIVISTNYQYFKFALTSVLPMVLFVILVATVRRKWMQFCCGKMFWCSFVGWGCLWVVGVIVSAILSIVLLPAFPTLITGNTTNIASLFDTSALVVFGILVLLTSAICLSLCVGTCLYNKYAYQDDDLYRYLFYQSRRQWALFLLCILFVPLMRTLWMSMECDTELTHLLLYPLETCPWSLITTTITTMATNGTSNNTTSLFIASTHALQVAKIPPIMYIALALLLLYGIGIPILFVLVITVDYQLLFKQYQLGEQQQQPAAALQPEQQQDKQLVRKQKREAQAQLERKYRTALIDFASFPSVLYNALDRRFRYYKIFYIFVQPLLFCSLASLLSSKALFTAHLSAQVQPSVALALHCIFFIVALLLRPYHDWTDDALHLLLQLGHILNLILGVILVQVPPAMNMTSTEFVTEYDMVLSIVLYSMNGLLLLVGAGMLCLSPVRQCLRRQRSNKATAELAMVRSKTTSMYGQWALPASTSNMDVELDDAAAVVIVENEPAKQQEVTLQTTIPTTDTTPTPTIDTATIAIPSTTIATTNINNTTIHSLEKATQDHENLDVILHKTGKRVEGRRRRGTVTILPDS